MKNIFNFCHQRIVMSGLLQTEQLILWNVQHNFNPMFSNNFGGHYVFEYLLKIIYWVEVKQWEFL